MTDLEVLRVVLLERVPSIQASDRRRGRPEPKPAIVQLTYSGMKFF